MCNLSGLMRICAVMMNLLVKYKKNAEIFAQLK